MTTRIKHFPGGRGLLAAFACILMIAPSANAQNRTRFGGQYVAGDYAYGIQVNAPALVIDNANPTVAGTATITVQYGYTTLGDGTVITPLAINAPVLVGGPSNQESVTPTAVSCATPTVLDSCTFTASFANAHGRGEAITSGTFGLQEAANDAMLSGGGMVIVSRNWQKMGGTSAILAAAVLSGTYTGLGSQNGFAPVVTIQDTRTLPVVYWAPRPTTLSLVPAGAAVTLTGSAGGSLTNSGTYYVSYEYVDPLGGISLPATESAQITLSSQNTITTSVPAATTGAVGWIPMITASGGSTLTEIEVPVTSAVCTLATSLVATGKPVCAIGSAAVITANPSATAKEVSEGTAHTTFAPQPFSGLPPNFQTQYGPFAVGGTINSGGTTNEDIAQFYTPAGYFNFLGKSWDICIKGGVGTEVSTSVLVVKLNVAKQYGQSPVTVSTITFPTKALAAAGTFGGCWEITTAATGSSGTFWSVSPQPWYNVLNSAPGTTPSQSIDVTTAASSAVDLTAGLYWSVNVSETAGANITGPIINSLSIKPVGNN